MSASPAIVESFVLDFPNGDDVTPAASVVAEYAILGGMVMGYERYIRRGANVDWSHPMNEAMARGCVEAWERFGWGSDEQWKNAVALYIGRYTGRHPYLDIPMGTWLGYMVRIYEWWRVGYIMRHGVQVGDGGEVIYPEAQAEEGMEAGQ